MDWPISDRLRHEYENKVLHEGIPDWLWSGVTTWVRERLSNHFGVSDDSLRAIERVLRRALDWSYGTDTAWRSLVNHMQGDHEYALDLLGFLVRIQEGGYGTGAELVELDSMLRMAGSAWHVRMNEDGSGTLERRVDAEQIARFETVAQGGRAGEHLRAAWEAMYGRPPSANTAYSEAVKAIEAAGVRVIIPATDRATLGTMISAFRDKPEKWDVALGETPEQGRAAVLEMMKAVWHGQHNRHGDPNETRPTSLSPSEAEAALHLALSLVHLFKAGLVIRNAST